MGRPGLLWLGMLACCLASALPAQDRDVVLRGEFMVDLETPPSPPVFPELIQPGYQPAIPAGEQARALLADAAWHFQSMIWGWDFEYTPSDASRQIAEEFLLRPRGEIVWGDPGLRVESVRLVGSEVWAQIAYFPGADARWHLEAWSSAVYPSSQGRGLAPAFPPEAGPQARVAARQAAVGNAVKEALRAYLRVQTFNKPRLVLGRCILDRVPRVVLAQGSYQTTVRVRIEVLEIIPYGQY